MKVRALRGVCIGVERHLALGAEADLDAATVQFLVSIGAVERVPDPPPPAAEPESGPESETDTTPAKPGKKGK